MAKKKEELIIDEEVELNDDDFRGGNASAGDSDQAVLVTRSGLTKLQEELKDLKENKRQEVTKRLKEAISYGDLSENSEYEEAKNEQAFIEGRVLELENKIKNAKIIKGHDTKSVQIGTEVTVKRIGSKEVEIYTIVGTTEANPFENKISNDSPIGEAIMERVKGEKVEVDTPSGNYKYEILKLK